MNKKVKKILIIDRNRLDGIFRSAYAAKLLKKRKNYNPRILKVLKKFQLPLELKRKKSNYIINNNFRKLYIKKNIKIIKNKILNK